MKETHPELWQILGGEKWNPRKKKTEIRYGCPHAMTYENFMHKRRLSKYSAYKREIRRLAEEIGLVIPNSGWALYFYIPIPTSWPKWKRKMMAGQIHDAKPDQKNLLTGIEDALCPHDETLGQMSGLGKFWLDTEILRDEKGRKCAAPGYIEILLNQPVYNPFSVKFIV